MTEEYIKDVYGMYIYARYIFVHTGIIIYVTSWGTGKVGTRYMAIGSKADRWAKRAGNDGQADLQHEQSDRGGRNLSGEVTGYYCFISKWMEL